MNIPNSIRAFLAAQTTLTLATTNADGSPYACDLFYVLVGDAFYFLSDPATRHIQNMTRAPRVSATIHAAAHGWQDIRGAQMIGDARRVTARPERARAFGAYLRRYAFVGEWFPRVEMLGSAHPVFGVVELYKIAPRWLRWIDNAQGLGHHKEFTINTRDN